MVKDDLNILKIIRQRRSVRRYQAQKVTVRDIHKILEAGRWAPSGLNNQHGKKVKGVRQSLRRLSVFMK